MSNSDSTSSGSERRRYARLPMELHALILLGPRPPLACVVKDFCVAGMFIHLDMRQLRFVQPRTPARLLFALTVDGTRREHELTLSVRRVTGNGLGVAFTDPEPKVVGLLAQVALPAEETPRSPAEPLEDTQQRFAPEFRAVAPHLSRLAEATAAEAATEFMRAVADALFIAARDAPNNRAQSKFLDAQAQFQKRAVEAASRIPMVAAKGVAVLDSPVSRGTEDPAASATSGMALVDKDEFEEFLTISGLASEFEHRYRSQLSDLGRRLSFLARREIREANNPLGPRVLGSIFAEAMKGLLADPEVSDVAFQTLRRIFDMHLERLYDEANALLIEHKILPQLEPERAEYKPIVGTSRRPTAAPQPLEASRSAAGRASMPQNLFAETLEQIQRFAHSQPRADSVPAGSGVPPTSAGTEGPQQVGPAPAGPIAIAPPSGTSVGIGGFGGFGHGPVGGVVGGMEQILHAARQQLALRQQLLPASAPVARDQSVYSLQDVADGLTELQHTLAATGEPTLYRAEDVKERIAQALQASGAGARGFSEAQSDALEILVNLFDSLVQDSLLDNFAKRNLTRLQGATYKAALLDDQFFSSAEHPLRRLLQRVSSLQAPPGESGQAFQQRIRGLLDRFNLGFERDLAVLDPVLAELDDALHDQQRVYDENVRALVSGCEEQQRVLRERREKVGAGADSQSPPPVVPPELHRWIARAKALRIGDRLLMNANTKSPSAATLVWIGDDYNPFVLADWRGQRSASLTLQQVAMYLRRGLLKPQLEHDDNAVDRALFGVINRLHGEIADQATHDTLTGLHNRKAFLQTVDALLVQPRQAGAGPVLGQLSVENLKAVNEQFGVATGDLMMKSVAEALRDRFEPKSQVVLGRLGGSDLHIFWPRGGAATAYRDMLDLIDKLRMLDVVGASGAVQPKLVAGLVEASEGPASAENLLSATSEACGTARAHADKPVYVAGSDTRHRQQLEQMSGYVAKAIERRRLALLFNEVRALEPNGAPAAHLVASAEDRNGKLVPPTLFVQAVANSPHAFEIDRWVLRNTLRWMAAHETEVEKFSAFIVPLSRAALEADDLATLIVNELMETSIPPARICFELVDQDAYAKLSEAADLINTLREFGCQFVLTEFGSQSNYEYLKELAVDFVGIQSGYIADARQDSKDLAMARSINELAHFMGKMTIARAGSDAASLSLLREINVDFVHDTSRSTRLLLDAND